MQRHREQTARLEAVLPTASSLGLDSSPGMNGPLDRSSPGSALLHSGFGAGPDTDRSTGLHSFAAVATTGAAQG